MDDLNQIIRVFDNGSVAEIENVLDIINDAWNYFPHKVLDGRCPTEILIQNKKTKLLN
ncbi:MAG: hypothetical protein V1697_01910 [Candidatus Levyibacteriota bacterium]